jgi:hypothetical protein
MMPKGRMPWYRFFALCWITASQLNMCGVLSLCSYLYLIGFTRADIALTDGSQLAAVLPH